MEQTPATIYLADNRGLTQYSSEQRYSTFNFAAYYDAHKMPFKNLCVFNEIDLAAGVSVVYKAEHTGYLILLPVNGALEYKDGLSQTAAEAGEAIVIPAHEGYAFTTENPFKDNYVSFLMINIETVLSQKSPQKFTFDIYHRQDELVQVVNTPDTPFSIHIGRFTGRHEIKYETSDNTASLFVFIIAGAFEAQNRLLHAGDGLALPNTTFFDAEALSNNAVLLLIELKPYAMNYMAPSISAL